MSPLRAHLAKSAEKSASQFGVAALTKLEGLLSKAWAAKQTGMLTGANHAEDMRQIHRTSDILKARFGKTPPSLPQALDHVGGMLRDGEPVQNLLKRASLASRLRRARNATHTHPTPGQAGAGNYAKGSLCLHGLHIKLENPAGTERRGYGPDGEIQWARVMSADYGYFVGSEAIDGDAVDVFIGPDLDSHFVVAIDQTKADGSFDETKFVIGVTSQEQAKKLYLAHYPKGWKLGPVSTTTVQQLKTWLQDGDTKSPFGGQMLKAAVVKQDEETGEWVLWTKDKKRKLGVHATPGEAYAQEYAIQKSQEAAAEKSAVFAEADAKRIREADIPVRTVLPRGMAGRFHSKLKAALGQSDPHPGIRVHGLEDFFDRFGVKSAALRPDKWERLCVRRGQCPTCRKPNCEGKVCDCGKTLSNAVWKDLRDKEAAGVDLRTKSASISQQLLARLSGKMPTIEGAGRGLTRVVEELGKRPKLEEKVRSALSYRLLDARNQSKNLRFGQSVGAATGGLTGLAAGAPGGDGGVGDHAAGGLLGAFAGAGAGRGVARHAPRLAQKGIGRVLTNLMDPVSYNDDAHRAALSGYSPKEMLQSVWNDTPLSKIRPPEGVPFPKEWQKDAPRDAMFRDYFGLPRRKGTRTVFQDVGVGEDGGRIVKHNPETAAGREELAGVDEAVIRSVSRRGEGARHMQKDAPVLVNTGAMANFHVNPDGTWQDTWDFARNGNEKIDSVPNLLRALVTPFGTPSTIVGKSLDQRTAINRAGYGRNSAHDSFGAFM